MKEINIDIEGKNTIRVLETATGVVLILKESEREKPKVSQPYYYVAFNVIKGFFCWSAVWRDSDMDNSLYEAGNCFVEETEPEGIAQEFNLRLISRKAQKQ